MLGTSVATLNEFSCIAHLAGSMDYIAQFADHLRDLYTWVNANGPHPGLHLPCGIPADHQETQCPI